MDAAARTRMDALRSTIHSKISHVLTEFADGNLSREQFHAIYEHYSSQLNMVDEAVAMAENADNGSSVDGGGFTTNGAGSLLHAKPGDTIAIRHAHMGKAVGLVIYHNKSGMFVETLGQFDVPPSRIAPTLNDFSTLMDTKRLIDRRIEKIGMKQWLLFAAGKFTTVVTLFHNEPSPLQNREIERLHHDFEIANEVQLMNGRVDPSKLAYPFLVFIQQKLKQQV